MLLVIRHLPIVKTADWELADSLGTIGAFLMRTAPILSLVSLIKRCADAARSSATFDRVTLTLRR